MSLHPNPCEIRWVDSWHFRVKLPKKKSFSQLQEKQTETFALENFVFDTLGAMCDTEGGTAKKEEKKWTEKKKKRKKFKVSVVAHSCVSLRCWSFSKRIERSSGLPSSCNTDFLNKTWAIKFWQSLLSVTVVRLQLLILRKHTETLYSRSLLCVLHINNMRKRVNITVALPFSPLTPLWALLFREASQISTNWTFPVVVNEKDVKHHLFRSFKSQRNLVAHSVF